MNDQNPFLSSQTTTEPWEVAIREDRHPLVTIWSSPYTTLSRVADEPFWWLPLAIASVGSFGSALERSTVRNWDNPDQTASGVFTLSLVVAVVMTPIVLAIMPHILRLTGQWLGGQATAHQLLSALAWSYAPCVIALPIACIGLFLVRSSVPAMGSLTAESPLVSFMIGALVFLRIWQYFILYSGVAAVQRFRSRWLALANVLLAGTIVGLPLFIALLLLR